MVVYNIQKLLQVIEDNKVVDSITLVGATKYLDLQETEDAILSGLKDVGENRLQQAEEKIKHLQLKYPQVNWHFFGRIQTNKIKKIVSCFNYLHSVESFEKLTLIDKIAFSQDKEIKILLQVSVSGEESKQGMKKEEILSNLESISKLKKAKFVGLMTMAPLTYNEDILRNVFRETFLLKKEIEKNKISCPELSMGMSNDFVLALKEGATMLRLGTILFNKNQGGKNEK
jgi:PLP dependent protein